MCRNCGFTHGCVPFSSRFQRYSKPVLRPDSHLDIYRRSKKSFNNRQLSALRQLFKWRDELARAEDESTQ